MKLKAKVAKTDEGTASYAVEFMGKTYPVDPGQKTINIEGVVFTIDGAPAEEKPAEEPKKKTTKKK